MWATGHTAVATSTTSPCHRRSSRTSAPGDQGDGQREEEPDRLDQVGGPGAGQRRGGDGRRGLLPRAVAPHLHNGLLALSLGGDGAYVLHQRPGHREGVLLMAAGLVEGALFVGRQVAHTSAAGTPSWWGWPGVWPAAVALGVMTVAHPSYAALLLLWVPVAAGWTIVHGPARGGVLALTWLSRNGPDADDLPPASPGPWRRRSRRRPPPCGSPRGSTCAPWACGPSTTSRSRPARSAPSPTRPAHRAFRRLRLDGDRGAPDRTARRGPVPGGGATPHRPGRARSARGPPPPPLRGRRPPAGRRAPRSAHPARAGGAGADGPRSLERRHLRGAPPERQDHRAGGGLDLRQAGSAPGRHLSAAGLTVGP